MSTRSALWATLADLIQKCNSAAIDESWKGAYVDLDTRKGDPQDIEVIELRYKLATAELKTHIAKMKRYYEEEQS